jgi:putative DNA primase/helicase
VTVELVPPIPVIPIDKEWEKLLKKKGKEIASVPFNAYLFFKYRPEFKGFIRWNKVTLKVEISGGSLAKCPDKENFDTVVTLATDTLTSAFEIVVGREEVGRRLSYVATENAYDPLQDYLDCLTWDGKPRVDTWLVTYAGAAPGNDGYVQFVGRKFLLQAVARAYQPGCKADVVLVAEGEQGVHKSTMFLILGGQWYSEAAGILGDKDSKQLIGSAWICELPDMSSFSKTSRNAMKAFFSSPVDRYRPPYDKGHITVKRRAVFAATTNDEEYLVDSSGNRRFQPVLLGEIDRARLIKDRDQLWAETVAIYKAALTCEACALEDVVVPGEIGRCEEHSWWLTAAQKKIAKVHAQLREETDSWAPTILTYALTPVGEKNQTVPVTTANILVNALKMSLQDITRVDEMRVAAIMRRAGYVRKVRGRDGTPWVPGPTSEPPVPPETPPLSPQTPEEVAAYIASKL